MLSPGCSLVAALGAAASCRALGVAPQKSAHPKNDLYVSEQRNRAGETYLSAQGKIVCPALPKETLRDLKAQSLPAPAQGMILTKILHVVLSPSPKCAPDGTVEYGNPTYQLVDAGQHLKRTQQSLNGIANFRPRRGDKQPPPSSIKAMRMWEFQVTRDKVDVPGPQFVALLTADDRRYTFATPRRPPGPGAGSGVTRDRGGGGVWGPNEAPRLLLAAVGGQDHSPMSLPGKASVPPGDVYLYRVGAPITNPPRGVQRCSRDGKTPPPAAREADEWQFWVFEKPSCFFKFCRGVWTDERLCENGPESLQAA